MGCKFSFKRVFLVASLCLAGLFGVSSVAINEQVKETPVVEEAKADSTYDYIWFYEACDWGGENEFDDNVSYTGKNGQWFSVWVNGSHDETKLYFGVDYSGSARDVYSEVIGPRLVKIYYASTITRFSFARQQHT